MVFDHLISIPAQNVASLGFLENWSFFKSYRRESQTQDFRETKTHTFHIFFLSYRIATIFNLLASVFLDLSPERVI